MQTLKEAREERGVKQVTIAKAIGISRQTYANYEKNPHRMPVYAAEKACEFLGVPVTDLFFANNG